MGFFFAIIGTLMVLSMLIFLGMLLTSILSDKNQDAKEKLYAPYHEAGHVVLAMVTGMGFDKVSVEVSAHNLGYMSHRLHQYATDRAVSPTSFFLIDPRRKLENALMTSLAGYVVEVIMCGKTKFPTHTVPYGDMEAVHEILMDNPFLYGELSMSADAYLDTMKEKTRALIMEHAELHRIISEELKVQEILSEAEVWALVEKHDLLPNRENPYSSAVSVSSNF